MLNFTHTLTRYLINNTCKFCYCKLKRSKGILLSLGGLTKIISHMGCLKKSFIANLRMKTSKSSFVNNFCGVSTIELPHVSQNLSINIKCLMNLSNKFSQIGILRAKRKVRENGKRNFDETISMLTEAY